jgi:hypothetical protein
VNKSSTLKSAALELGEVKVHSTLGQPLRASIAYALGPNEAVSDTCVTLQKNMGSNGLPAVDRASMIVADGVIAITGSSIVHEPLMTMRVNIRCPYTPQLTREYMMFIDPVRKSESIAAPIAAPVAARPQITRPATAQTPVAVRRRPVSREPIADNTRYQVQPGETASEIAQRVENRPVGVWKTVNLIVAGNPDAFVDNDPNKLKAGSWLTIPNFGSGEPAAVADAPAAVAYEPATVAGGSTAQAALVEASPAEPATAEIAVEPRNPLADLQPGDVILDSNNPFVAPVAIAADESVVIPDTLLEGPTTSSSSPNVPIAVIRPAASGTLSEPRGTNWMLWLGGSGIAIIALLLLFGRRIRDRFGSAPIVPARPQRRETDGDTQRIEAIGDVDMLIEDDSPTSENLALDADLIIGTGLQDGIEVDIAQDYGFAATTDLDLELPEEMSSGPETPATDIIPPLCYDEQSILESEVLPGDDYDMSVIMDATKMPHPEDVTERDLEAIQVESDDGTLITGDYTVSQEVDYKIIEQDYEDEMTATQALNAEIQKAAEDLAVRMDDSADDETTEMPLATVYELDVTAQLPAKDQQPISDDDDTGINPTVNMDAEDKTAEMKEDNTVEMPRGGSKAG